VAFLKRVSRSSGMDGAKPACFMILVIVFPVVGLVRGTPCWSLRIVPILLGLCPSLASFMIIDSTSSGVRVDHVGGLLPTGRMGCEAPFSFFGICLSSEDS